METATFLLVLILSMVIPARSEPAVQMDPSEAEYNTLLSKNPEKLIVHFYYWPGIYTPGCDSMAYIVQKLSKYPRIIFIGMNGKEDRFTAMRRRQHSQFRDRTGIDRTRNPGNWILMKNGSVLHILQYYCENSELDKAIIDYSKTDEITGNNSTIVDSKMQKNDQEIQEPSKQLCQESTKLELIELKKALLKEKLLYFKEKRAALQKH